MIVAYNKQGFNNPSYICSINNCNVIPNATHPLNNPQKNRQIYFSI